MGPKASLAGPAGGNRGGGSEKGRFPAIAASRTTLLRNPIQSGSRNFRGSTKVSRSKDLFSW